MSDVIGEKGVLQRVEMFCFCERDWIEEIVVAVKKIRVNGR